MLFQRGTRLTKLQLAIAGTKVMAEVLLFAQENVMRGPVLEPSSVAGSFHPGSWNPGKKAE